jgi:2,3-diaminopropionate biosynthesis protein SbnA
MVDSVIALRTDRAFLTLRELAPDLDVVLKIEAFNAAGSIKLTTAAGLIEDAEQRGLKPGGHVIESSSGNLGIALSSICAAKGYRFTCVTDPNTARTSVRMMRAFGAEVVTVAERDANGGYLGTRIRYITERLRAEEGLYWTNQYANPANPAVHYGHTARVLHESLHRIDYLFVAAGTTGTLMGCADYFRANSPATVIVAVDAAGSITFGGTPRPRHIPGMGASRRPELCRTEMADMIVHVEETDTVLTCRAVARRYGILVGGSTGSVLAAVRSVRHRIRTGARVVAICTDLGDRYLDTIYDDAWVAHKYGPLLLNGLDGAPAPLADSARRSS